MKTKIYPLTAACLLIFLSIFISGTYLKGQTLTLLSPNGGEIWLTETTQTISWSNSGDPANIMIEYSVEDGGYWYYLGYVSTYDTANSFTFYNYMPATTQARVRISDYNDATNMDESDGFFTVKESPVYFYTPYYSDSYYRTSVVTLEWYSYTLTEFNLAYSTDNGATWTGIADNWTDYTYDWTVPDLISDECFIRITDPADPDNYGISSVFSIVDLPTVSLVSPNGGETWTYNEAAEVSWTGTNLPYYVYLDVSTDGGLTWNYLGYGYSSDTGGTTAVYVPYEASTNAYVRVSDPSAPDAVYDISDAPFTIFVPPVIVYYPYEGQQFYNKSQTSLSWLATGIDSLKIELSSNNGMTWTTVEQSIDAGMWGYYWTVNGTPSENCVLKFSDASDPTKFGLSNTFTILETPVITLTYPDGSDILNTSTTYTITWEYDNPSSYYVLLEYSPDSGQNWNYIGYVIHDGIQGSVEWQTPAQESEQYLLRIRDYSLYFVSDTSAVFSVLSFPETPICMVTVDSATNNNVIVWEKPLSPLINHFIVYRESSQANVYEPIGTVDYSDVAIFADTSSNPVMKSYRYKLGFTDAAGHLFPMSGFHQTIHLSINQGVGNSWNLIWTSYQGFDVGTYTIYRSSNGAAYEPIAEISSSFNSYTDFNAPAGDIYYIVEVVNPNGCNPASRSDILSVSRSNIASNHFQGTIERDLGTIARIYPNPASDHITVSPYQEISGRVTIELTDILGKKVYREEVGMLLPNSTTTVRTSGLNDGIYFLTIKSDKTSHTARVIINN